MNWKSLYVIAGALVALPISAQWLPVTGTVVAKTEVIAADGTVAARWKTTSSYARSASGAVLVQRLGRSGKPTSAILLDYGRSQKAFSLTYHGGQVNDLHQPLDKQYAAQPPTGMSAAHKKVAQGKETVNGVDCFIVPIYDTGPNRTRIRVGRAWMAPAYNNLIMREDSVRSKPDGTKRHVVREMTLTGKSEPDAALFATDRTTVAGLWKAAPGK